MKKKIIVLLLLILAGMGIFLSRNGWCLNRERAHNPWPEPMSCPKIAPLNNPYYGSAYVNIGTRSSTPKIYIFDRELVRQRGNKDLEPKKSNGQNLLK
jgi:hypothetical protein